MGRQIGNIHLALGDYRVPHHIAGVAQAACIGLAGFELGGHLQRHGLFAVGLDVFSLHLQATELQAHRARGQAVREHHVAFFELEFAQTQFPWGR